MLLNPFVLIQLILQLVSISIFSDNNSELSEPKIEREVSLLSGATVGDFSVADDGSALYSIAIQASPGTAGMKPNISLNYSSNGRNGLLGLGWSILGLSSIQRAGKTIAQDGKIDGISFDENDSYALDGERLVLIDGKFGQDGSLYATEQNVQMRVKGVGSTAGFASPRGFEVRSKAGIIMEFGMTNDSRIEAQGKRDVMTWAVNRMSDTKGNYIDFSYSENNDLGEYYPTRIDYTGNTRTGLKPYCSIVFNYSDREDDAPKYISGARITSSKILKSIDCLYENNLVRRYYFEYEKGEFTNVSLLKSIQECGTSASECLPPTIFTYEEEKKLNFSPVEKNSINYADLSGNDKAVLNGDWNGDGKNDLFWYSRSSGENEFYLNSGNFKLDKITLPSDSKLNTNSIKNGIIQVSDVNNDGYSDLFWFDLINGSNKIFINLKNNSSVGSSGFKEFSNVIPPEELKLVGKTFVNPFLTDLNGDGKVDIFLYLSTSGRNRFFINKTVGGSPSFSLYKNTDLINGAFISTGTDMQIIPNDWDNDGLCDLLWVNRQASSAAQSNRWFRNTGDGNLLSFSPNIINLESLDLRGGTGFNLNDWNGDGYLDIMWLDEKNGESRWWLNDGNFGFKRIEVKLPATYLAGNGRSYNFIDFNGDGASDLMIYDKTSGFNHWLYNDGKLDFTKKSDPQVTNSIGYLNLIPNDKLKGATNISFGAYSGNGGLDLLWLNSSNTNLSYKWFETDVKPHFFLKEVVNGLGHSTRIKYGLLTDQNVYKPESNATYPFADFISPVQVVSKYEVDDGLGGKVGVQNVYAGGKIHLEGRGFRGFKKIESIDLVTGISSVRNFDLNHKYISSSLTNAQTKLANGQILGNIKQSDTLLAYYKQKAFASFTVENTSDEYDLNKNLASRIKSKLRYDDYGNVLESVAFYEDGQVDSIINSYSIENTEKWIIGRLTRAETFKKTSTMNYSKRVVAFEYDKDGMLVKEIIEPDLPKENQIIKEYIFDNYGNVIESRYTFFNGNKFETRTLKSVFDSKGRFVLQTINSLGHTYTKDLNPANGNLISETNANGISIKYFYDSIGRLIKTEMPDGSWQSTNYLSCKDNQCPEYAVFLTLSKSSSSPDVYSFFDVLGREVMSQTKGFDGTKIYKKSIFNKRGLLEKISAPYYENEEPVWTSFIYDSIGREIQKIEPGNRIWKTIYNGLTTVHINPLNQIFTLKKGMKGKILEAIDNNKKSIKFTYDQQGRQTSTIDSKGNQISYTYDIYGNIRTFKDPDMGVYKYVYNSDGQCIKETNPKGEITEYFYDELGRCIKRVEPEGTVIWKFDEKPNGIGLLSNINYSGYSYDLTYDSLSRPFQETKVIQGKSFRTRNYYDNIGRLSSKHYPGGFSVKYDYNERGYMSEIKDNLSGKIYWQLNQVNARNQTQRVNLGNGVSTNYTYDRNTFLLKNINSSLNQNQIQDLTYEYNVLNLLVQRSNNLKGKKESFTYDNLNRLTGVSGFGTSSMEITYDELGNITSKSDVGKYYYGENGLGPHQISRIEPFNKASCIPSFTTDFEFTSFNMLKKMQNDSAEVSILYNQEKGRVFQQTSLNSKIVETKYYVNNIYEYIVRDSIIQEVFYISGPDGVIAVNNRFSDGETDIQYWHKNHLGSIETITNQQGIIIEQLDFDAWGNRILEKSEKQKVTLNKRGFTGHEHLDYFSLINMNGRVYDPVLARFISPDPYIQDPVDLQNYNRYSYVLNSPLNYTDPSGFFWKAVKKAFGDVFNTTVKAFNDTYGKAWKAFDDWGKTAFQNDWNTIKVTGAMIAVAAITGGLSAGLSPFTQTILSGAAGGFTGAAGGVLAAGGSYNDALKAGIKGAIIGGATAAASYGIGSLADKAMGGGKGAFHNAGWTSRKFGVYGVKMISHGIVQGAVQDLSGEGQFVHGFLAGAAAAGSQNLYKADAHVRNTAIAAIAGGTASELGGGKFSNGAQSGAFVYLHNCGTSLVACAIEKFKQIKPYCFMNISTDPLSHSPHNVHTKATIDNDGNFSLESGYCKKSFILFEDCVTTSLNTNIHYENSDYASASISHGVNLKLFSAGFSADAPSGNVSVNAEFKLPVKTSWLPEVGCGVKYEMK